MRKRTTARSHLHRQTPPQQCGASQQPVNKYVIFLKLHSEKAQTFSLMSKNTLAAFYIEFFASKIIQTTYPLPPCIFYRLAVTQNSHIFGRSLSFSLSLPNNPSVSVSLLLLLCSLSLPFPSPVGIRWHWSPSSGPIFAWRAKDATQTVTVRPVKRIWPAGSGRRELAATVLLVLCSKAVLMPWQAGLWGWHDGWQWEGNIM